MHSWPKDPCPPRTGVTSGLGNTIRIRMKWRDDLLERGE